MEFWQNDIKDYEKYAFLLGSSLRNNDLEHFFGIYDTVLPKYLTDKQLDLVKERARVIAELPDREFDDLVVNARDFSLAGHPLKMNRHSDERTSDSDEEDGQKHLTISQLLSEGTIQPADPVERDAGLPADPVDRDSGLPSSSKATGSYRDSFSSDGSDNERHGVFSYFPLQSCESVKIIDNCNPDFDEAHEVESDSPHSDASSTQEYDVTQDESVCGTEMRTFNTISGDFEDDCPSDGERFLNSQINSRTNLYNHKSFQRTHAQSFRSVDENVSFFQPTYSRYTSMNEADNAYARKEKLFARDGKEIDYGPPFGHKNQLANVCESIPSLLSSHDSCSGLPPNMPEGELLKDEGKKKRKKKKGSKDDSDEQLAGARKFASGDINGNTLNGTSRDKGWYKQMRELPKTEGSSFYKQGNSYGTCNQTKQIPRETTDSDSFSGPCQTDRDLENSSSNLENRKKRKRNNKEPVKYPYDYPDYVGNKLELDELVQFIEKGEKQQLKKKANRKNATESAVAKPDKLNKKNKDKKDKSKSFDSSDISLIGEQPVGSTNTASSSEDMGNSSDKPSTITNEKNISDISTTDDTKLLNSVVDKVLKSETVFTEDKNNKVNNQIAKVVTSIYPNKKDGEIKDKNKQKVVKEKKTEIQELDKKMEEEDSIDNKKTNRQKVKAALTVKNNKKVENMVVENGPSQDIHDRSNRDLSTSPNSSSFIFTDIDPPPPLEAEFTVVGKAKKKKRPGTSETPKHKNNYKEHRTPHPGSSTPPPFPMIMSSKDKTRDLSPSAFPVLGLKCNSVKGRPSIREGRRNSFGDVPIDSSSLRSLDDSDIESVKSLPAAQGGRLSEVTSSRFPVSYAKMAAAPKPPNSPNSSVPLSPGSCDDDDVSSPKTPIWKGSLHERRHSIGSSPEDTKPDASPKFNQRIRQKSGSQDILNVDKVEALQMEVKVSNSSEMLAHHKDSVKNEDRRVDVNCVVVDKSLLTDVVINSSIEKLHSTGNNTRIPEITFTTHTSDSNIPEFLLKGEQIGGPKKYVKSIVSNTNETSLRSQTVSSRDMSASVVSDGSVGKSTSNSSVNKDLSNKTTNVIKITNNGRKPKSSVVFLDKRFIETPQKLDITFGFDSNLETETKVVREPEKPDVPIDLDSVSTLYPVMISVASTHSDDKMTGISNQSIQSPPGVSIGCVNSCKSASSSDEPYGASNHIVQSAGLVDRCPLNSSNISQGKVSKSHITGLNGVVQSHSQGYRNKPAFDALRTENNTSDKTDSVSPVNHDKAVLVFYGEGILAKIGDGQICVDSNAKSKQIKFVPDNNITSSKFNSTEAISFLKREWDNIIEMNEKNPKTVVFYDGQ